MATLKREVKKLPSESNLRLLSSLIVSLANKQSSLEDKCIAPWKADETYQKDISYVSHNGYVYICSVTNQDSVFTESHWTKLADEFTELDVDTIKSYLNLTQEQITNLQTLIDDTTITTTKTNSSSKIYMDIQAAIAECKDDTLKQIAKKVSGSYKIATSTAEVTSADHIYLINNGANYDLYVLVDSTPTKVGDTSIDLSDYAKLADLDSYYDKSASDGKFATITTVDNHIADTDVHVTKELKDKLVTTDDIATTISENPSDEKVLSEKAISNKLATMDKECKLLYPTSEFTTLASYIDTLESDKVHFVRCTLDDAPVYNGNKVECAYMVIKHGGIYIRVIAYSMVSNQTWERWHFYGGWATDWQRVTTTKIDDVPMTTVDLTGTDIHGAVKYTVKSGICYVSAWGIESDTAKTAYQLVPAGTMPKPAMFCGTILTHGDTARKGLAMGQLYIDGSQALCLHIYIPNTETTGMGYGSFSYPVAES